MDEYSELGIFKSLDTLKSVIFAVAMVLVALLIEALPNPLVAAAVGGVAFLLARAYLFVRSWFRNRKNRRRPLTSDPRLARARGRKL